MKTTRKIFKIIVIIYFAVFYCLSWGGVYALAMSNNQFMRICALALGLVLILLPAIMWILRKDLKKDSRD